MSSTDATGNPIVEKLDAMESPTYLTENAIIVIIRQGTQGDGAIAPKGRTMHESWTDLDLRLLRRIDIAANGDIGRE